MTTSGHSSVPARTGLHKDPSRNRSALALGAKIGETTLQATDAILSQVKPREIATTLSRLGISREKPPQKSKGALSAVREARQSQRPSGSFETSPARLSATLFTDSYRNSVLPRLSGW